MNKIKIVTDSTMDMSSESLLKYENEIEVVPLSVTINGEMFLDRVELIPADFIKMMHCQRIAENLATIPRGFPRSI